MNKLFTKIAALSVGLTLAVGVGVAVNQKAPSRAAKAAEGDKVTTLASIVSGYKYYIGATVSGTDYYWKAAGGTSEGSGLTGTSTETKGEATVVTLSGSGSNWSIQFENGNYLSLASSKANGKYVVETSEAVWTFTESSDLLNLSINGYCLQKNSGTSLNFGSYKSGQKDVWLEEAANEDPGLNDLVIKNSSSQTGPFNNLSDVYPGGYMFYAYDSDTGTQKNVTFSIGNSSLATLVDNGDGSCCITPIKSGSTKLYAEMDGYNKAEATLVFNHAYAHAGTEEDPYSVTDGIAKCQEIGETASGEYYVKGYITQITSSTADVESYGNATFNLSDDPDDNTNILIAFQVKYIGNVAFTVETFGNLKVGHIAVVRGALVNYKSSTPEFNGKGNSNLVSLEAPSTGEVSITFDPAANMEIGDSDTFEVSCDGTNPTYTWTVDDNSILSVDSSGAYEALSYGKAKVTVHVSADEGEGETSAYIVVNGHDYMNVEDTISHIEALGDTNATEYYLKVEGYVSNLNYISSGKSSGIYITDLSETHSIIVYTGSGGYSDFVDGLKLGHAVRIQAKVQNYHGDTPELTGSPVRVSYEYVAMTFAQDFLDSASAICSEYDGVTSKKSDWEALWDGFETSYNSLTDLQKSALANPSLYGCGNTIVSAMELYDYVTGKYELDNFISGRTPVVFSSESVTIETATVDNNMMIIAVIAAVSAVAFAALLIVKKKRHN